MRGARGARGARVTPRGYAPALPRRGPFWVLPAPCHREPRCRAVFATWISLCFESGLPGGQGGEGRSQIRPVETWLVRKRPRSEGQEAAWSPKNYEAGGETCRECGQDTPFGVGSCRPLESAARVPSVWGTVAQAGLWYREDCWGQGMEQSGRPPPSRFAEREVKAGKVTSVGRAFSGFVLKLRKVRMWFTRQGRS